jgi:predicted nucleic acid-binding protein
MTLIPKTSSSRFSANWLISDSRLSASITNYENISIFSLDMGIADHVVEMRAHYHFKTPDAIQLGTAIACGADYIITNDKNWRRVEEIPVLMVGDL